MDILNDERAIVFLDILNEIAIVIFGRSVNFCLLLFCSKRGDREKRGSMDGNIAVEYK